MISEQRKAYIRDWLRKKYNTDKEWAAKKRRTAIERYYRLKAQKRKVK